MAKHVVFLATFLCMPVSSFAQDKTWTVLSVYSDGRVSIQENISSESTCKAVLCFIKDSISCEDKIKADLKAKEDAARRAAEYEERVAKYRIANPCKIREYESTSVFDGKKIPEKKQVLDCPMPDGGQRTYDKDGILLASTSSTIGAASYSFVGSNTYLKIQACFQ